MTFLIGGILVVSLATTMPKAILITIVFLALAAGSAYLAIRGRFSKAYGFTIAVVALLLSLMPFGTIAQKQREAGEAQQRAEQQRRQKEQEEQRLAMLRAEVTYTLLDEKVSDTPIKTQIRQDVLATALPTREGLEAEILRRYHAAVGRRGFRYYNPATNIFIYVYGTREQAQAGQGLWIGMIAKTASDRGEPKVQISEERLAALKRPPEARLGLSESARKQVFQELVAAEDRATRETNARIPASEVMRRINLEDELHTKYKADVARRHKLSDDQLDQIIVEGLEKGWPSK